MLTFLIMLERKADGISPTPLRSIVGGSEVVHDDICSGGDGLLVG